MKLGQTSLLEFPLVLLSKLGPWYGSTREPCHYEHFYTGFTLSLIFAFLMQIDTLFYIGIVVTFALHVIVKEVFLDAKKRINKAEMLSFKTDMVTRISGFIFALPAIIYALWT